MDSYKYAMTCGVTLGAFDFRSMHDAHLLVRRCEVLGCTMQSVVKGVEEEEGRTYVHVHTYISTIYYLLLDSTN